MRRTKPQKVKAAEEVSKLEKRITISVQRAFKAAIKAEKARKKVCRNRLVLQKKNCGRNSFMKKTRAMKIPNAILTIM